MEPKKRNCSLCEGLSYPVRRLPRVKPKGRVSVQDLALAGKARGNWCRVYGKSVYRVYSSGFRVVFLLRFPELPREPTPQQVPVGRCTQAGDALTSRMRKTSIFQYLVLSENT